MRLEITTHIGCPVNCVDCPQALLRSRYKGRSWLNYDDYTAAIDKVPTECRIDFSGMCEPYVHPRCTDMILYAAARGHPLALYTTLQGATKQDLERLKDIPFEVVTIHIPDKDNRSTFHISDEYLNLLSEWPCDHYSCHGDIDDRVLPYLRHNRFITYMHDRAGNVATRQHRSIAPDRQIFCATSSRNMDHNVLLPDGTVIMCCMDYGCTGIFGNLFKQTYDEVIHSPAAEQMRQTLEKGDSICRHCAMAWILA